jgi:hypothetical protein
MFLSMPKSPRTLHRLIVVRALVSSVMLGGCVEATAYEQAASAAEVQAEGRRRAGEDLQRKSAELRELRREYERLKAENVRLQDELSDRQGAVAQAELDLMLAKQERSDEASLVQQLRGDLARVGTHLDVFADEKAGLGAELAAARAENDRLSSQLAEAKAGPAPSQPADEAAAVEAAPATGPSDAPNPVESSGAPDTAQLNGGT